MPEELLRNSAVEISIGLIMCGIIAIAYGADSESAGSQDGPISDIFVRMGFAMLSVGGGGLFSMMVLIENIRRRRKYTYSSIVKRLCSISTSILTVLIVDGIRSNLDDTKISKVILTARSFQDHSVSLSNAIPESDYLIEIIEDYLEPAVEKGYFNISAFESFSDEIENDMQHLLVNLLPTAFELTIQAETKNYLDKMESICNLLNAKLAEEDWIAHNAELLNIRRSGKWHDYRQYILTESKVVSTTMREASIGDVAAIGRTTLTYLAVSNFSNISALLILELAEYLWIEPPKIHNCIANP